jgi:hypothetical protein
MCYGNRLDSGCVGVGQGRCRDYINPNIFPGKGFDWDRAYMSATDKVTVLVCADVAGTPRAGTYNVKVIR